MDLEYYQSLKEGLEKEINKKRNFIKKIIFSILFITLFLLFQRYTEIESLIGKILLTILISFYPGFLIWSIWDFNWILEFSGHYQELSKKLKPIDNTIKKLEEEIQKEGIKKLQELKNIYINILNKRINENLEDEYENFFNLENDLSKNKYHFNYTTRQELKSLNKYSINLKERIANYCSNKETKPIKQIPENNNVASQINNDIIDSNNEQKVRLTEIENFKNTQGQTKPHNNDDWESKKKIKIDFLKKNQQNMALGLKGELIVLNWEKNYLTDHNLSHLAEKIRHISQELGDGAGFDILSYDTNGDEKFIEVKTTKNGVNSQFYFSENELNFIKNNQNYYLYRLSLENDDEAELTIINKDDLLNKFQVLPYQYIVKLKKE